MVLVAIAAVAGFAAGLGASHFVGAAKLSALQALEDRVILAVKAEIAKLKG